MLSSLSLSTVWLHLGHLALEEERRIGKVALWELIQEGVRSRNVPLLLELAK